MIYEIGDRYNFKIPCFGHAGDGNIHVNVMIDISQIESGHRAIEEIFKGVLKMGGTLSWGSMELGPVKAPNLWNIAFLLKEEFEGYLRDIKRAFGPKIIY